MPSDTYGFLACVRLENDRKKLLDKKKPIKIASLFMKTKMQKTKIHAVFELGTCGLVEQSYTHCATKLDIKECIY